MLGAVKILSFVRQAAPIATILGLGYVHNQRRYAQDIDATAEARPIDGWQERMWPQVALFGVLGFDTLSAAGRIIDAGISAKAILPTLTLMTEEYMMQGAAHDYLLAPVGETSSEWGRRTEVAASAIVGMAAVLGAFWLGRSVPSFVLALTATTAIGVAAWMARSNQTPERLFDSTSKTGPLVYFTSGMALATMVSSLTLLASRCKNSITLWRGVQPLVSTLTQSTLAVGGGFVALDLARDGKISQYLDG